MRATTRRATAIVAAGVLGAGGVAILAPSIAGAVGDVVGDSPAIVRDLGPGPGPNGPGAGMGPDAGMGSGAGMGLNAGIGPGAEMGPGAGRGPGAGPGARDGTCALAELAEQGTLTASQQQTLAAMAEEEKLAHDLYAAFAEEYDVPVFDRLATAESAHLNAVRTVLDRYGMADPTAGKAVGQFADPAVQQLYDRLLAEGGEDLAAALQAGRTVEQTDIDDLRAALEGLTAPDVRQLYEHLLQSSQRHLTALQRWPGAGQGPVR